jgi:hypothetical protein
LDYGVKIYTGEPEGPYTVLGQVAAKQNEGNIEDVSQLLIEQAVRMGANAIINVDYQRKVSMTSWSQLIGTGTAVMLESDERDCPSCAEKIKRAAKKCRFCGETF